MPISALELIQIAKEKNSTYLDLNECELTALPDELSHLPKLQWLDLSSTAVSDISVLSHLPKLQHLNIYCERITDISVLSHLPNLQQLSLYCERISDIDISVLSYLTQLQMLSLYSEKITDISVLSHLTQLQYLSLSTTQVSDISVLSGLIELEILDISHSQVSDISALSHLTQLKTINLSSTQVSNISPLKEIIKEGISVKLAEEILGDDEYDEYINGIYVKDCPLDEALIAAIKKGNEAVLSYLNKAKKRLFEARVLVLGEPHAGKTTLRRKLKSTSAPMPTATERTKAFEIEIDLYPCIVQKGAEKNKMTYHLWDFGGEDYYRLLHQLFVAEQSVYVIVTDTDRNKNEEEIDFWLETIQRLGRDKHGKYGPVILLQNPKTNRTANDFTDLKKRYPFWQQTEEFVINLNQLSENEQNYDKQQAIRFKRFKEYLEESFCHLAHVGKEMPTQWINIRKELVKYEKENWMSVEAFQKICRSKGITNPTEQEDLLDIFHTLGFLLHYKVSALKGMVILNKEWVADALYHVLDDKIIKGWFKKEDAEKIWNEEKYKNRTSELLSLMEVFRLSYFNTMSQKYIIPAKLNENTADLPLWDTTQNVRLHLQYDWMPRAIPTQLIVSLHENLVVLGGGEEWIWRRGAVLDGRHLDLSDVQVRIEDNWRDNKIEIAARGANSELLIRLIMNKWKHINEPFEDKVTVTRIILCHCEKCQTASRPFEFEYDEVLEAKNANDTLKCNKSRKNFAATDILKGIFDESTVALDVKKAIAKQGDNWKAKIMELYEANSRIENMDINALKRHFELEPKKIKILMLTANPHTQAKLNVEKEYSIITRKLQSNLNKFDTPIMKEAVTITAFREYTITEHPTILHFSGHGEAGKDGGLIVMNDDRTGEFLITDTGINVLFEYLKDECKHLKAVILNACHTEMQAATIAKHFSYVIGTTINIGDELAIDFSSGFYFKLASAKDDFRGAFKSGRTAACMKGAVKKDFVIYENGDKIEI